MNTYHNRRWQGSSFNGLRQGISDSGTGVAPNGGEALFVTMAQNVSGGISNPASILLLAGFEIPVASSLA
jgi:hypothetical protein